MQVSYFETGRYYAPSNLPREWPMPAGAYDREAGLRAFRGMVERSQYAEELGFDWVSVSEHHYSPRILTPALPIAAAYIAQHVHDIKIALLGPIVPQSNPVQLAEEGRVGLEFVALRFGRHFPKEQFVHWAPPFIAWAACSTAVRMRA